MTMRPLGLTAMGIATPLGRGKADNSAGLFSGTRGTFAARDDLVPERRVLVGTVAGDLPRTPFPELDCRNNRLMQVVLDEIRDPIADAARRYGPDRIAVVLGTSTSGIADAEAAFAERKRTGVWPSTFDYQQQEIGGLSQYAVRYLGLRGPAYTVAVACSSSAKVFASARRLIRSGVVDAAVVGGADTLSRMTLNGFATLEALSPTHCNPFSANRDGITIGEGASAFLVEPTEAEVMLKGIGESSDAYHASAPDPTGLGAASAMRRALADAGLPGSAIAYVNLHGTATPLNDAMESKAVAAVLGGQVPASSTKPLTGHMLGAAGGCEAAFLWLALTHAYNPGCLLPPHVWDGVPDPELPSLNLVTPDSRLPPNRGVSMLTSSFAFGGSNMALVMGHA
ncbi:beta-ketoacyl-[acyl-carrier-protein] synthase family protein [Reyranella sp. CPCC 100927]|uniref:beta-ketoacyl-[acyl-carrier-protein] synthase family protein n=1 Tax=Reyranella sp. CPCC 100927 TaxID=2599616 RepID=UPI0011B7C558|nr:beta-ketoacyl-[acyl-carrier-protein] synthase family protein [Reyranella sp. CPCC 100927]TWT13690.1 beta-ketoacyl-[acyl-carrier-protein] synthase family protein [Reyranella sp. CPCC 100927]